MAIFGVIGASGFVGQHLSRELVNRGHSVRAIVRSAGSAPEGCVEIVLGYFSTVTDWKPSLQGLDIVICLAARVHVMHETETDPLAAFRKVNVDVTQSVAEAAARAGIERLVFMSSIKVNGEGTTPGNPYRASDAPKPEDPYGVSKLEAENALRAMSKSSDMDVVIIRPPLVYGPGVGGNFLKLLKLASSGLPLPLGSIRNARAMISVDNLIDAVIHCSLARLPGVNVVLVNDEKSISTSDLLRLISGALKRPSRLFSFPSTILMTMLKVLGKQSEAERLMGNLDVEISSEPPGLEWKPPYSTADGVERTATWFGSSTGARNAKI